MKSRYSTLSIVAVSLLFGGLLAGVITGCQKLSEDPQGSLTPASYFKTQNDLDASVAGMYIQLARDGAWGFTSKETSYFGSDDLTTDPKLNKADQREFDQLQGSSTNGSLPAEWNGPWQTIYNANYVIANYQKITTTNNVARDASAGQAYFLRGVCYYYLVRTFGPLPLVTEPQSADYRPARSDVSAVYALIISDLQKAKT